MKQLSVVGVGLILCGAAQAQDPAVAREPTYSLATTSALLRFPGSPFDALRRYGVSIEGSITSVYQGGMSGSGDKRWQLGGKGDLFVTIDGDKAALWSGFFVNFHQEWNFGRDANRTGPACFCR